MQVPGPGEVRGIGVEDEHARSLDRGCGGRKPGRNRAQGGEHEQDKGAQQRNGGIHGTCLACRPRCGKMERGLAAVTVRPVHLGLARVRYFFAESVG